MKIQHSLTYIVTAAFLLVGAAGLAHAHDKHAKKSKAAQPISTEETAFGRQGDPKKVDRTIEIAMSDNMRFTPAALQVKQGETIRFVIKNNGKMLHEMVLGTMAELKEHGEMMKKHPGMEHDEPYQAHVGASKKGEMIWQFTKAGEFNFACLIPGHFEAGMVGNITVAAK